MKITIEYKRFYGTIQQDDKSKAIEVLGLNVSDKEKGTEDYRCFVGLMQTMINKATEV